VYRVAAAGLLIACAACAQTPVILISVDTLRADHLGAYGYSRIKTPHIDALARGGTLFTSIDAQIPLTLPSHTSLLTSTYPFANHIEENGAIIGPGAVTLEAVLRAQGYRTAAFIGSVVLDRRYGLDQGFDVYDSPFQSSGSALDNAYSQRSTRDATLVLRAARQWLAANRDHPAFAFIHLYDLHLPYRLPGYSPLVASLAGYDAELQYVDDTLGRFQEALTQSGLWDRALVVLLADHGEGLGEHGESGHGYFIYESTLHVPLIMHWPVGAAAHAERVTEPGGLIDVAPTILEFLHIPAPASFQGKSLFGGAHAVVSESAYARDVLGWAALRGIRSGGRKYIEAPQPELYDLLADPGEKINLDKRRADEARTLKHRIDDFLEAQLPGPAPSANTQALRSLGYLAGPAAQAGGSRVDPKDRIREYEAYARAVGLMYAGRAGEAVSALRAIAVSDPRNNAIQTDLGHAYLNAGSPEKALAEWEAVAARDPAFTPAYEAEGFYWLERGEFAKARAAFEKTLTRLPRDYEANLALSVADEKLGLKAEAEAHRKVVCADSPATPGCGVR
jgi:arylsulfatase A-like enzyme